MEGLGHGLGTNCHPFEDPQGARSVVHTDDDYRHSNPTLGADALNGGTGGPGRGSVQRPLLLVIAENLQFPGQVDLANRDSAGHRQHDGGEIENRTHPGPYEPVGCFLGRLGGGRKNADADVLCLHDLREIVEVSHASTAHDTTDFCLVGIEDTRDRETPLGETAVVRERLAKVARTNDDDRPIVVQTQLELDLIREKRDVVPHSTCAVAAEVREIFANLCRIHSRELGQLITRHLWCSGIGKFTEDAQVEGQPGQRGFGYATAGGIRHGGNVMPWRGKQESPPRCSTYNLRHMPPGDSVAAALAASACLVASAFCLLTFDRWMRRRTPHDLAWTVAMALFVIGAGALWWAESRGWSSASFRIFFLAGAVLNVAWLALGTVYLLFGRRVGDVTRTVLVALSGYATGVVAMAPMKAPIASDSFPTAKELFGATPRILAGVGSGVPAVVIIAGALWSAVRVARGRVPAATPSARRAASSPRLLALGNVLIAAGALVLSASGTLAGRLGKDTAFAVTLVVGIVVLFAGFVVASNAVGARPRVSAALAAALSPSR